MFDFVPMNEQGVVFLFGGQIAQRDDVTLLSIGAAFPDATIGVVSGDNVIKWDVEFEYVSSNFLAHDHDVRKCDVVICWVDDLRHTDNQLPIPVIELKTESCLDLLAHVKTETIIKALFYWKKKSEKLQRENDTLRGMLASNESRYDCQTEQVGAKKEYILRILRETPNLSTSDISELVDCSPAYVRRLRREFQEASA